MATQRVAAEVTGQTTTADVLGESLGGGFLQYVKPTRRGTADYDSGRVAVSTGSPALVTATTIYPEGGTVGNSSNEPRVVTITDGSDGSLLTISLQPQESKPIPVPTSGAWAGWKVGATGTGVTAQVSGRQ